MKSDFSNWSDLRVFLAVVRSGSTLAASKSLGLAQPTVARRIDALEHATGTILFERDTRGFRPTAHGTALIPHAEAVEAAAQGFTDKVRDLTATRPIRITSYSVNLSPLLSDILDEYATRAPDVQFEFLPGIERFDLMTGEADIALRIGWTPHDPELIVRHICKTPFTLFGAPEYAEQHGLPRSPEDMADHTIFLFWKPGISPVFRDWIARYVPPDRIARVFSEVGMMSTALRSGRGLAIENLRGTAHEVAAGRLIPCFDPPEALTGSFDLLVSPEAWRRPEVRRFVKFFAPRYTKHFR